MHMIGQLPSTAILSVSSKYFVILYFEGIHPGRINMGSKYVVNNIECVCDG